MVRSDQRWWCAGIGILVFGFSTWDIWYMALGLGMGMVQFAWQWRQSQRYNRRSCCCKFPAGRIESAAEAAAAAAVAVAAQQQQLLCCSGLSL